MDGPWAGCNGTHTEYHYNIIDFKTSISNHFLIILIWTLSNCQFLILSLSKTLHFLKIFLVKKSVRVISSLYCCHNLVARHYRLGGKILTAFIRCLVIYVKPCPIISQTIGRSAVIPRALTDLLTYRLTYPLARHFELAWAGNICNELLWRKLKLIWDILLFIFTSSWILV